MVTIQTAKEEDIPTLLEIYNDIIIHTTAVWHEEPHTLAMRQEWFAMKKEQGFPVFTAAENGKVIGFSTIGPFRPWFGYRFTVENSVYVASGSRGKGVAKLLLHPLIDTSRQLNIHAIVAGIEATNEASIALHEKLGFVEVAHFKEVGFKFNRWMDLKFLELIITDESVSTV
jgi:L-amino acid N-acyltransferase YncA